MFDAAVPVDTLNENHLLFAVSAATERRRFQADFEEITLAQHQIIDLGNNADYAYFPLDSVISITSTMREAALMELAMVGRDGLTGVHKALGFETNWRRGVVTVPGTAVRIKSSVLHRRVAEDSLFSALLMRYFHALHTQIMQAAICFRLHKVQERLQTWLTMMFDRTGGDELKLKQEEIAAALNYQRPTISNATAALQEEKIISYSRGHIQLLDGNRLKQSTCECYKIMESQYAQISSSAEAKRASPQVIFMENNLTEPSQKFIQQLDFVIHRIREICSKNDEIYARQKEIMNRRVV